MNYVNPSKLQAAIDWAGTVVDFGSFAPTQISSNFAEFDVQVSIEEARGPMGMGSGTLRTLCDQPQVAERYRRCSAARRPMMTSPRSTTAHAAADREDRRALGADSNWKPPICVSKEDQDRLLLGYQAGHG